MESTLFTEISDSKQRIARISNEGKAKSSSGQKTVDPSQYQDSYTYDDIYKVWMGDVQKQETGSLIKSSFMVFEIRTVRQVDEETVSVWKRYKELYAWYVALISELEEIEYNPAIKFPMYSENWLTGDKANGDVNSDFVQRRRIDLQNFFQSLFNQYPLMYEHPMVMDLLQLHRFSPVAKGTTIYSKPEAYYDVFTGGNGGKTSNGGRYNGSSADNDAAGQSNFAGVTSFQPATTINEAYVRIAPKMATNNNSGMSIASFITDGTGKSNVLYNRENVRRSEASEEDSYTYKYTASSPTQNNNSVFRAGADNVSSNSGGKVPATAAAPSVNEWAV